MKYVIDHLPPRILLGFDLDRVEAPDFADLDADHIIMVNGVTLLVRAGMSTDGASIPKELRSWLGDPFATLNLYPAILHDAGYCGLVEACTDEGIKPCYLTAAENDAIFEATRLKLGGSKARSWTFWAGIRLNSTLFEVFRKQKAFPSWELWRKQHPGGVRFADLVKG